MDRRRFLALGAGGAAVLAAGGLAACGSSDAGDGSDQAAGQPGGDAPLIPLESDGVSGLDAIGIAYVSSAPAEASRDQLAAALDLAPDAPADPDALLAERADAIHVELATGEVVELDGWVLSRTEARIAGLAAWDSGAFLARREGS